MAFQIQSVTVQLCKRKYFIITMTMAIIIGTDRSVRRRVYETIVRPSVRPSVCLSACPIMRPQQRRAAGLLLSAERAGDIDRQQRRRTRKVPGAHQQHGPQQQQMRAVSRLRLTQEAEHRLVIIIWLILLLVML